MCESCARSTLRPSCYLRDMGPKKRPTRGSPGGGGRVGVSLLKDRNKSKRAARTGASWVCSVCSVTYSPSLAMVMSGE